VVKVKIVVSDAWSKMKLIDLTMPMTRLTPVYPGDPEPEFSRVASCEQAGWNAYRVCVGTHFGTHIEAPWHLIEDGKKLGEFPIERFVGQGVLFDVRGHAEINVNLDDIQGNKIVLFRTDHTEDSGSPDFFKNYPVLSKNLAEKIIQVKPSIVGIDSFTIDKPPHDIHKTLFKHEVLCIENLVNLKLIPPKDFTVYALPVKLNNFDGAPCRVIAQVE
jgi:kynurenine formamidase